MPHATDPSFEDVIKRAKALKRAILAHPDASVTAHAKYAFADARAQASGATNKTHREFLDGLGTLAGEALGYIGGSNHSEELDNYCKRVFKEALQFLKISVQFLATKAPSAIAKSIEACCRQVNKLMNALFNNKKSKAKTRAKSSSSPLFSKYRKAEDRSRSNPNRAGSKKVKHNR